ncbi:Oidioi.mRNA.OKI2018_I69.PAR.g9004.t1.cds [Oikopleura dioica]|uniref:Oidioi.mRNA.OKI2018_I69.PAR.g9004.t1.cds n=1 Tax=Oikopleura dioica TaxID=34765 RepID=A0ABN7RIJ3_OIKDI|nr:Oidioi.mRNA.OKI2018_I69.PAR.g9004.t1.cds [Oikopleura dioica]
MNEVQVTAEYKSEWDTTNNCGPRPGGMIYPRPPETPGTYEDQLECDIISDNLYLPGYNCTTTCKADPNKKVNLFCDCYNKVLTFSIVKPCRWAFEGGESCPAIDDEDDWNCDPRKSDCGGIYPDFQSNETTTTTSTTTTTTSTTTTPTPAISSSARPAVPPSNKPASTHHVEVIIPSVIENKEENSETVSFAKDITISEPTADEKRTIINHFHIAPFLSNVLNNGGSSSASSSPSKASTTTASGLEKIKFLHEKLAKLKKVRDRLFLQLKRRNIDPEVEQKTKKEDEPDNVRSE